MNQRVESKRSNRNGERIKKKSWTTKEDTELTRVVNMFSNDEGDRFPWTKVASYIKDRSGKQCRERWFNYLKSGLKKSEWTDEEDNFIIQMQEQIGNQWSKIALELEGRSDNSVKNRWYSLKRLNKTKKRDYPELDDSDYNQVNSTSRKSLNEENSDAKLAPIANFKKANDFETLELEQSIFGAESHSENCLQEFKHDDVTESDIGGLGNLKSIEDTDNTVGLLESIESVEDLQRTYSPKRLKTLLGDNCYRFQPKVELKCFDLNTSVGGSTLNQDCGINYSEPSPIMSNASSDINHAGEDYDRSEIAQPTTPSSISSMMQDAMYCTPLNDKGNYYLTPVKADETSRVTLFSVSSSKINLTEWWKGVEQGPSLGIDVLSTLEMLSPAPIRL